MFFFQNKSLEKFRCRRFFVEFLMSCKKILACQTPRWLFVALQMTNSKKKSAYFHSHNDHIKQHESMLQFSPTLGVGVLDFKLNFSPRPELFSSPGLLLAYPWSAQPPIVPGVPNPQLESP